MDLIRGLVKQVDLSVVNLEEQDILELAEAVNAYFRSVAQKKTPAQKLSVPVFAGFTEARYQEHDALITKLVQDFNAHKTAWTGGTPAQAAGVPDLTAALVKAQLIQESGGKDARSLAAWAVDPMQVNVPGDWSEAKSLIGLVKPAARNEGTAEGNIRAGIMWLARKGFSTAAIPAARIPKATFEGWPVAVQRYNGRVDKTAAGIAYGRHYATRILNRASDPKVYVPIKIKLEEKKPEPEVKEES